MQAMNNIIPISTREIENYRTKHNIKEKINYSLANKKILDRNQTNSYKNYQPSYHKIIDNIYLGDIYSSQNIIENSNSVKVTHIISLIQLDQNTKDLIKKANIKHLRYYFHDSIEEDIVYHFYKLYPILKKILHEDKGIILVHCYAGISRSASIVMLILLHIYNCTYTQASQLIDKSKRQVFPNERFRKDVYLSYKNKMDVE